MPVLRSNGKKYDINLMKQYLHKSLEDCSEEVLFAIQKANAYMSLETSKDFFSRRNDRFFRYGCWNFR